ncbi:MAG: class I SAM-dependent methyltransferase [Candidatus Anammoxibacter sp.]
MELKNKELNVKDIVLKEGEQYVTSNQSENIISGYEHIQGEKLDDRSELEKIKDDKFRSYQKIRDKLCHLIKTNIKIPKHGIVVDLGTGSNAKIPFDIRDLLESEKGMVVGLEITEGGTYEAYRKKNKTNYSSLKILRSNSITLPFKDNSIDVVTANLSIHHIFPESIYDKSQNMIVENAFERVFHETFRVLQYDGLFLVSESVDPTTDINENMLFRGIHKTIHNIDDSTRKKYEQAFGVDAVESLFKLAEKEWGVDIRNEPPVPEYLISPTEWKKLAESVGLRVIKYIRVSPALAHFVFVKD